MVSKMVCTFFSTLHHNWLKLLTLIKRKRESEQACIIVCSVERQKEVYSVKRLQFILFVLAST